MTIQKDSLQDRSIISHGLDDSLMHDTYNTEQRVIPDYEQTHLIQMQKQYYQGNRQFIPLVKPIILSSNTGQQSV